MKRLLALVLALVLAGPSAPEPAAPAVVFLVRHAEKAVAGPGEDARDPHLSPAGHARAGALARLLADAGLTAVYATPYHRTRETAHPVAERLGLPVQPYAPSSLAAFADTLRAHAGRVLVVGHSNTTPALVRHLGGTPGPPIAEDEYDRLYVLTLSPGGPVTTVVLRYGPG